MATNTSVAVVTTLAADVANNGTFTVGYPSGYAQADFQGANANTADEAMIVNSNDRYDTTQIDFSYGSTTITVTNKTGITLKAGARVALSLPRGNRTVYRGPQSPAITQMTAANGTANDTIPDVGAAFSQATLNNIVQTLVSKINAQSAALKAAGITS